MPGKLLLTWCSSVWLATCPVAVAATSLEREDSGSLPQAGRGPAAERIRRAIEAGRGALLPRLRPLLDAPRRDYPIGRAAIVVTALLKAGAPTETPAIVQAFAKLATQEPQKTYCASTYLFALAALKERLEARLQRGAENDEPVGPAGLRARMADLAAWLVRARSTRGGSWTYDSAPATRRHDFSNTQFAVLALEVAMAHGVEVPVKVFADLVRLFAASIQLEAAPVVSSFGPAATFEALLGLEPRPRLRHQRLAPGGWAYRARRGTAKRQPAYAAMTAAGASSLVIAIKALERSPDRKWRSLVGTAEEALYRSYAWIETHFDDFTADRRGIFYALYSLEKVGDLGGVETFGKHDWYAAGCRRLLDLQRADGSWGSYVDTALALLFLTRATQMPDRAAAPVLLTRGREALKAPSDDSDLVYIDSAGGFFSARSVLGYMARVRNPDLVPVGREIVRNYDSRKKEDLVPLLLQLWGKIGRLTTFARRALRDISGESFRTRLECERWHRASLDISALAGRPTLEAAEVAEKLRTTASPFLKAKLVRLAHRRGLRSLRGALIDELTRVTGGRPRESALSYCRLVHGILTLWTGSEIEAPRGDDVGAWRRAARAWEAWRAGAE